MVDSTKVSFGRVETLLPACFALVLVPVLVSTVALAEAAPADRPTSSPPPTDDSAWSLAPPWYQRVEIDARPAPSLGLHLRHAASKDGTSARRAARAADPLSVGPGKVALSLPAQPAGLHLDLHFVPGGDGGGYTGTDVLAAAVLKRVRQAYATVRLFNLLTVDLGKFVNVASPGAIEATRDWLGSRAERLIDAPGQAGLRFALPVSDVLTLRGSVLASQAWKTFNLSATVHQPSSGTSVFVDVSGGPNVNSDLRLLFDVVVNQALHGEVLVTDSIRLAGHVEYFGDRLASGLGSNRGPVDFITATIGAGLHFVGAASFELRPELRRDQALGGLPGYRGGVADSKTTVQLAAIARF